MSAAWQQAIAQENDSIEQSAHSNATSHTPMAQEFRPDPPPQYPAVVKTSKKGLEGTGIGIGLASLLGLMAEKSNPSDPFMKRVGQTIRNLIPFGNQISRGLLATHRISKVGGAILDNVSDPAAALTKAARDIMPHITSDKSLQLLGNVGSHFVAQAINNQRGKSSQEDMKNAVINNTLKEAMDYAYPGKGGDLHQLLKPSSSGAERIEGASNLILSHASEKTPQLKNLADNVKDGLARTSLAIKEMSMLHDPYLLNTFMAHPNDPAVRDAFVTDSAIRSITASRAIRTTVKYANDDKIRDIVSSLYADQLKSNPDKSPIRSPAQIQKIIKTLPEDIQYPIQQHLDELNTIKYWSQNPDQLDGSYAPIPPATIQRWVNLSDPSKIQQMDNPLNFEKLTDFEDPTLINKKLQRMSQDYKLLSKIQSEDPDSILSAQRATIQTGLERIAGRSRVGANTLQVLQQEALRNTLPHFNVLTSPDLNTALHRSLQADIGNDPVASQNIDNIAVNLSKVKNIQDKITRVSNSTHLNTDPNDFKPFTAKDLTGIVPDSLSHEAAADLLNHSIYGTSINHAKLLQSLPVSDRVKQTLSDALDFVHGPINARVIAEKGIKLAAKADPRVETVLTNVIRLNDLWQKFHTKDSPTDFKKTLITQVNHLIEGVTGLSAAELNDVHASATHLINQTVESTFGHQSDVSETQGGLDVTRNFIERNGSTYDHRVNTMTADTPDGTRVLQAFNAKRRNTTTTTVNDLPEQPNTDSPHFHLLRDITARNLPLTQRDDEIRMDGFLSQNSLDQEKTLQQRTARVNELQTKLKNASQPDELDATNYTRASNDVKILKAIDNSKKSVTRSLEIREQLRHLTRNGNISDPKTYGDLIAQQGRELTGEYSNSFKTFALTDGNYLKRYLKVKDGDQLRDLTEQEKNRVDTIASNVGDEIRKRQATRDPILTAEGHVAPGQENTLKGIIAQKALQLRNENHEYPQSALNRMSDLKTQYTKEATDNAIDKGHDDMTARSYGRAYGEAQIDRITRGIDPLTAPTIPRVTSPPKVESLVDPKIFRPSEAIPDWRTPSQKNFTTPTEDIRAKMNPDDFTYSTFVKNQTSTLPSSTSFAQSTPPTPPNLLAVNDTTAPPVSSALNPVSKPVIPPLRPNLQPDSANMSNVENVDEDDAN
jgi:hypothetical protein